MTIIVIAYVLSHYFQVELSVNVKNPPEAGLILFCALTSKKLEVEGVFLIEKLYVRFLEILEDGL